MARKSIRKNYIYNVLYQVLTLLTPMITAPYLSRVLEADGIGRVSYVESVVSYFTLFAAMGMATFGQREVSYLQDDRKGRTVIFWEVKILELLTSAICSGIYVIYAIGRPDSSLYLILIFNLLSVATGVTWVFQGMEEFGRIVSRNLVFKVLNIIYIFTAIRSKEDLLKYLFGLSFFSFLSSVSLWFWLPKVVGRPKLSELRPFRHMKIIISLFIPTIAIQIYTVLDKTMIGVITRDSFENGYYELAIKISKMVMAVVTALGTVMIPRIGYHFEQGETQRIRSLMYRGYRFVWFLGVPLCLGMIMVCGNFVPWFFGEGYEQVVPLLQILSFLILAIGINNVTGMQYMIPTKRQNIFTLTVIIGATINFMLNMVLIRSFQAIGAAVASVVAETVIAVVQLIIVRKELSPWTVLLEGRNYYISGILMAGALGIMEKHLNPSIMHTILLVSCGALIYFGVLLVLKDEFFFENARKVLKKIRIVK